MNHIPDKPFKESKLAHEYLDGLKGVEIGASWWNPFGLDTINVDWKAGEGVDVVAEGDELPFKDNAFDFVISSHVIEHFWDPIGTLFEWKRVASKYIFLIVPHFDRSGDNKPGNKITFIQELEGRFAGSIKEKKHRGHHCFWRLDDFLDLCEWCDLDVIQTQDPDDKVGNGFTVVINADRVWI